MKMHRTDIMEEYPALDSWSLSDFGPLPLALEDFWSTNSNVNDKLDLHLDMTLEDSELQNIIDDFIFDPEPKEMIKDKDIVHDCMWAGTCSDKCHPAYEQSPVIPKAPTVIPQPPVATPAIVQSANPGRSLLINSTVKSQPVLQQPRQYIDYRKPIIPTMIHSPESPLRPDTPQSLDEEIPQFKHNIDIVDYDSSQIIVKEEILDDDEEENEDEEEEEYSEEEYTNVPEYTNVQETRNVRENTIASDHSYTLNKNKQTRVEVPGVQTPSDSEEEEEIDVVSLVEMSVTMNRNSGAMQTNPSILARRQLQRKVASGLEAHSIAAPPRKRPRERSASPINRHRKRPKAPKQRAQQHHHHNGHHAQSSRNSPTKRRPYSSNSDSEAENIERRSLHNDMERQRRIGLKNLFDELKSVVPTISQKDRAPKVVVLREAALLCERVQLEEQDMDDEMDQLKMKQTMLMARLRQLRREAASRRPKNA